MKRTSGFSLSELMVVLVVVAILAAIALPTYTSQLRRSARGEAQAFLTNAGTRQSQYLIDKRTYAGSLSTLGMNAPADLLAKYTFALAAADGPPPTYTFTATAIGDQAHDTCPTLTLDNAGNRTPATCW